MNEAFRKALKFVLKWEGGYTPPQPGDPNPTNYGIIQRVYDSWRKEKGLPTRSVKEITMQEVEQIYWERYWLPAKCELVKSLPAKMVLFDTCVNMGLGGMTTLLRKTLNKLGYPSTGELTKLIEQVNKIDPLKFAQVFLEERRARYRAIAQNNPAKARFLKGWLNRVNDLEKTIKEVK